MTAQPRYESSRGGARRGRPRRFYSHSVYLTCAILACLALWSFWPSTSGNGVVTRRDLLPAEASEDECRLVHGSAVVDKCAFIRTHCAEEEPGFLAYLDLYYCTFSNARPVAFALLAFWLGLLFSTIGIAASDFFCIDLSTIATIMGLSESLAGVTLLALGNGSPDLFSTFAAMSSNSSSLAIGELIGAAGFITAVVAGSMALVRPFKVSKRTFIRDICFFIVAAAFSMGFLSDGDLHLWECVVMVTYYFFYVAVVVTWHWWIKKRAKRRAREAAARGDYSMPGQEGPEVDEAYHDDPEEDPGSRPPLSRGVSTEDFWRLEAGNIPMIQEPEPDAEDAERELLGEISSNMRVRRAGRHRSSTITPIRPSLAGALEFQAVLSSLSKARNMSTIPMHARRYSEDQTLTIGSQHGPVLAPPRELPSDLFASASDPSDSTRPSGAPAVGGRARAASASNVGNLTLDPSLLQRYARRSPQLLDINEDEQGRLMPPTGVDDIGPLDLPSDVSAKSPPRSPGRSPASSPIMSGQQSPKSFQDLLAPPVAENGIAGSPAQSPGSRPRNMHLRIPSGSRSPLSFPSPLENAILSKDSSRAASLHLPPASLGLDSHTYLSGDEESVEEVMAPSWWPSRILPSPAILFSTLTPTLYHWRCKTWWELLLGIVAAPSVLLLTLTLPVVEAEVDDESEEQNAKASISMPVSPTFRITTPEEALAGLAGTNGATVAVRMADEANHVPTTSTRHANGQVPDEAACKGWYRWLTISQLYLAPMMVVIVLYTQYLTPDEGSGLARSLVRPLLISLLASTILLVPLLLTTTTAHRPKAYVPILSIAGFIVSIAWISTIANQVVAVLKTFAIIMNMSHAILGLTVFAVGNSLGDLVADITVAKLGYPVMALSACFGGPMLNILLGIGLSGCYILIGGASARHAKHPDRAWKAKSYEIEVGDTLIVSGVTLLLTLVGLLVVVPLNNWMMSRRIAWGLIGLWCTGTVINVGLEIAGLGSKEGSQSV